MSTKNRYPTLLFLLGLTWGLTSTVYGSPPDDGNGTGPAESAVAQSLDGARFTAEHSRPDTPDLFHQVGSDFRSLFSSNETLVILGAGAGASLLATRADTSIPKSRFNSELFEGGGLDHVFEPGDVLGGSLFQFGGAFATFALGKMTSSPGVEDLGRDLVRAQILDQALTQAFKLSVRRPRPDGSGRFSFPSGHTSGAFATATILERRYGWKVGLPAYGVACYVAASRLNENKHFLSDVVFGAAIGILAGRTVTFGHGRARFSLSPMIIPGGAGIQMALVPQQ